MEGREQVFSNSHSWIFASLSGGSEAGSTLVDIVRNADMLNHAVPTIDEVVGAIETLHSHGLIRIGKSRIALTAHGQKVLASGRARRGGLSKVIENVGKALNSPVFNHPAIAGQADTAFLTDEAFSAAYAEYTGKS